jgi:dTMP kinase
MAGLFVTFEGIDRSGKTTQARMLCDALGDQALAVRERLSWGPRPRRCCSPPPARSSSAA